MRSPTLALAAGGGPRATGAAPGPSYRYAPPAGTGAGGGGGPGGHTWASPPFSYGIHPDSPVLQKRKMLAEAAYITEGVGRRPPEQHQRSAVDGASNTSSSSSMNGFAYQHRQSHHQSHQTQLSSPSSAAASSSSWLERKKQILAERRGEHDESRSARRRREGELLAELRYSLERDAAAANAAVTPSSSSSPSRLLLSSSSSMSSSGPAAAHGGPGGQSSRPIVTVISTDATMTRRPQQQQSAAATSFRQPEQPQFATHVAAPPPPHRPLQLSYQHQHHNHHHQGHRYEPPRKLEYGQRGCSAASYTAPPPGGSKAAGAFRRQTSLPARFEDERHTSFRSEPEQERDQEEYVRPTTPTRVIVPEIVRQMNEINERQKRELQRSESLRQRTLSRSATPLRSRSKSKSPVNAIADHPRQTTPPSRVERSISRTTSGRLADALLSDADIAAALANPSSPAPTSPAVAMSPPSAAAVAAITPATAPPPPPPTARWYRPTLSREEAVDLLRDARPGAFVVRDSTSYPAAYGLALRVPHAVAGAGGAGSHQRAPDECVRHFLIEPVATGGVRLRGSDVEPVFASLTALVQRHSVAPLSLPHRLVFDDGGEPAEPTSAEGLLRSLTAVVPESGRGASFTVIYLGFHETGMLTGPHAIKNGFDHLFADRKDKSTDVAVVIMKVNTEGISLTDHERRLFFRIHFPMKNFRCCDMDPGHRHWEYRDEDSGDSRGCSCFGVVSASSTDPLQNECHMFAELDQPASLLVEEINRWSERSPF